MLYRRTNTLPRFGWTHPFAEVERMRRQMDALSNWMWQGGPARWVGATGVFPSVNLTEDAEHYYVRAELPGMKATDLDIQVTGRSLAIAGERTIHSEGDEVRYHRKERESGRFSRIVTLPGDIDPDKVEATMTNGLLTVAIAKSEAAKPKQIAVN